MSIEEERQEAKIKVLTRRNHELSVEVLDLRAEILVLNNTIELFKKEMKDKDEACDHAYKKQLEAQGDVKYLKEENARLELLLREQQIVAPLKASQEAEDVYLEVRHYISQALELLNKQVG